MALIFSMLYGSCSDNHSPKLSELLSASVNICRLVNYPLSKANGFPASSTSQPTISTGVNSDSPCPIYSTFGYLNSPPKASGIAVALFQIDNGFSINI